MSALNPRLPVVSSALLARMLNVLDYGILMVTDELKVMYANQVALVELQAEHPLRLLDAQLLVPWPADAAALHKALASALRFGGQSMVTLSGPSRQRVSVSVVPLREAGEAPATLLIFGKDRVCEELSVDAFAREHALTLTETRVLKLLCAGRRPGDIAEVQGVRLTTVRTQIGCIRAKTGSRDIGAVVNRVSRLPPLPSLMRSAA